MTPTEAASVIIRRFATERPSPENPDGFPLVEPWITDVIERIEGIDRVDTSVPNQITVYQQGSDRCSLFYYNRLFHRGEFLLTIHTTQDNEEDVELVLFGWDSVSYLPDKACRSIRRFVGALAHETVWGGRDIAAELVQQKARVSSLEDELKKAKMEMHSLSLEANMAGLSLERIASATGTSKVSVSRNIKSAVETINKEATGDV